MLGQGDGWKILTKKKKSSLSVSRVSMSLGSSHGATSGAKSVTGSVLRPRYLDTIGRTIPRERERKNKKASNTVAAVAG